MSDAPLRLLLLEDTDSDALRIRFLLDRWDRKIQLTRVERISEALRTLNQESFDLLLLDLCVPDGKGLDTFDRIHAQAGHLPIIVQSGLDEDEVGSAAVRRGAQDFLVKGAFDQQLLFRAIRYALERKGAEQALRESEDRYKAALAGANDGIWDWDLRSNKIYLSPRWSEILGMSRESRLLSPETWMARIHPDDSCRVASAINAHMEGLTEHLHHEHRVLDEHGEERWVLTRGLALRDDRGRAIRMAGSMSDISAQKQAELKLRHDAFHDSLTGLPNRTLCLDRIGQAMKRARRNPDHRFAFLFIDLDRFKLVNDSLGHSAGDALLVSLSSRLREQLRPGDTLVRLSGDEFGVLLEELGDERDAKGVADRIQTDLLQPFHISGQEVYITASIGIAQAGAAYTRPEDLVRDADLAMYQAKKLGKARYEVCDTQLHAQARKRLQLETALRQALDNEEFELHYQPIVNLNNGRVRSFEALIRWRGSDGEFIPPGKFINIAEDTGLIVPIGAWVVHEAVHALMEWCPDDEISISVNLSPRQFLQPDMVPSIAGALKSSGLPAHRLSVEITEGVFIEHGATASRVFADLQRLGVSIHLDDFGTGYSSLGYLRRFPVDCVKIDRSFLSGLGTGRDQTEIIRAIVALGATLGIDVIAEGIETAEQLNLVRSLRCEMGQGFLFARPCSAPDSLPHGRFGLERTSTPGASRPPKHQKARQFGG
jgi:diguanylate cyclase (GGDEF)-like protein/PAS domain S-box-containing protein